VASVVPIRSAERDAPVVAVVADQDQARARITAAIACGGDLLLGAAATALEVPSRGTSADLVVFHCDQLGSGELAVCSELKRRTPALLIVVVSESENTRSGRRAADEGVDGLVFAGRLEAALVPTIAAVLAGQVAVPRELRSSVRKPALSFREKQILGMVALGCTNGEIASRLFLAESTVKTHLSSAFDKLGVRSRSEAAAVILDSQGSLSTAILAIAPTAAGPRSTSGAAPSRA
jgi:DNA-binding NarL/FixJ family response regulator